MRVSLDGHGPIAGVEIVALPFDAAGLLDSLGAHAPSPRPAFAALEAELAAYRLPDPARSDPEGPRWRALYDSTSALSDSLNALDRRSPRYAPLYERFQALYGRLARETAVRETALRELRGPDLALALRAQHAAESLRVWEREAFARYDELAEAAVRRSGRAVVRAVTDEHGSAHLSLAAGRWWLMARRPDPDNPFLEYAWSQPLTASGWLPVTVPLWDATVERRWRH